MGNLTFNFGAPCRICGYNGPGFYQAHTHRKGCPFRHIAGDVARQQIMQAFLDSPEVYIAWDTTEPEGYEFVAVCFDERTAKEACKFEDSFYTKLPMNQLYFAEGDWDHVVYPNER